MVSIFEKSISIVETSVLLLDTVNLPLVILLSTVTEERESEVIDPISQ